MAIRFDNIKIQLGDIVKLDTDAVVNAANSHLAEGSGVCGAIFRGAGSKKLTEACDAIGGCETGSAVITPGFGLKAKYIIHAVDLYGEAAMRMRANCSEALMRQL